MIEIDNLIKSYGQLDVIKGINMNVEKGEVISIIVQVVQENQHYCIASMP